MLICSKTKKVRYLTYEHACHDAREIIRKRQIMRKKFVYSVYRCNYCGDRHVGSTRRPKRPRRSARHREPFRVLAVMLSNHSVDYILNLDSDMLTTFHLH